MILTGGSDLHDEAMAWLVANVGNTRRHNPGVFVHGRGWEMHRYFRLGQHASLALHPGSDMSYRVSIDDPELYDMFRLRYG